MEHKPISSMIAAAAASIALLLPMQAQAFDREALVDRGEVFVIALTDALDARGQACAAAGNSECAAYFAARTQGIKDGGEIYALPISQSADIEAWALNGPSEEYAQTYALITSEAADMEPRAVAHIQTAYEGWVQALDAGDTRDADIWHARWSGALNDFTRPQRDRGADEQLVSSIN